MIQSFGDIFKIPELKKKIFFTLGIIAVYRVGAAIPIPDINTQALRAFFQAQGNTILGFLDMFSGGALGRFSIFSMGIMPYINASIIMSLLTGAHVLPYLDRLQKEGDLGRKKINQITRYLTLCLGCLQSFGLTMAMKAITAPGGAKVITNQSWGFVFLTVLTLTTGTVFIMWLGEQITENGIGNGISLIIFAGIVDRLPSAIRNLIRLVRIEELSFLMALFLVALVVVIIALVVWVETGQRKIPVQYAKRVVGRQMVGGASTYLPIKVDQSGVIAVIFAMSVMTMPMTIAQFFPESAFYRFYNTWLAYGSTQYNLLYAGLIIFFCYFYNSISFNPHELAENMKKWGGFISGIRPGEATAQYISKILERITLWGALFVATIAVMPEYMRRMFNAPFYFGGTALLIVVGVALDTIGQLESHLIMRHYDGFMKSGRIKGRWFNVK
ncbi:MAG: preprotein translocase subunit SecY [Elusimicrobia bacterium]|nr:preprotein translocase subunit SecY [Elusimicrobiota bacterium]MBD3412636.1 preprotein translocase subunit SecY [Elusimicrobiota bacterium]